MNDANCTQDTIAVQRHQDEPPTSCEKAVVDDNSETDLHQELQRYDTQGDTVRATYWTGNNSSSAHDRYMVLFEYAPAGYVIFDARGTITGININAAQMLGLNQHILLQIPFSEFIANDEDREIFFNHLTWVQQKHCVLRCEIRLTRRDGSVVSAQLQSAALYDGNASASVLTSMIDITVRKQLEESLQQAYTGLDLRMKNNSDELVRTSRKLSQEIEERRSAEESLHKAYAEIRELKERFQAENIYLHQEIDREHNFGEIIGESSAIKYVFFKVEQVAPQDTTVLLLGETGTGKGVVAHAIHSRSSRRDRPLVTVNCTSLPTNLIESELFGREKGAFTGSTIRQIGRFELADGGTIFLDEIGDMPLELQTKLLRVIQDGEFERLGSPRTIKVNVRIIAASNRNLDEEIRTGRFREDLFYRLNVFPITIPPLRKRTEDIPLLVNYFVAKFNKKIGKNIETVSRGTLNTLQAYHWPGNVRELESVIERAVITSPGSLLQVLDHFEVSRSPVNEVRDVKALGDLERDHILQVLHRTGWRIEGEHGAARLLGLNSSTLRGRMRKFGIKRQEFTNT